MVETFDNNPPRTTVERTAPYGAAMAGVLLSCLAGAAFAAPGGGMDLTCKPPTSNGVGAVPESRQVAESIVCRYRLRDPAATEQITAALDGRPVSAQLGPEAAAAAPTSAVLFAIDVSNADETRLQHVYNLVDAGAPGHRFALASFGGELDVSAPFGSNAAQIKQAAANLGRSRLPTELYRNALEATRLLANESTERKALFLFSDGLAEDRAYFHQDVVDAARSAGVIIYGIGYPRSLKESVGLQSLRRLADETGGHYVAADEFGVLPAEFFDAPYAVLDNVGEVRVPRPAEGWPPGSNPRRLALELTTANGKASATAALDFPAVSAGDVAQGGASGAAATLDAPGALFGLDSERTLLYSLIIAGLLAVMLGASAMWLRSRRTRTPAAVEAGPQGGAEAGFDTGLADEVAAPPRAGSGQRRRKDDQRGAQARDSGESRRDASASGTASGTASDDAGLDRGTVVPMPSIMGSDPVPVEESAFLERMGEEGDAYPMLSSPLRIGRQSDNDIVLKDPSISRHHAVVERLGTGEYVVKDLGALNGVIVNGMRKPEFNLKDGDVIELGDLAIKFGLEMDEASQVAELESEQETMVLKGGLAASAAAGLSLASFGSDTDDDDGFNFLDDDHDELKRG